MLGAMTTTRKVFAMIAAAGGAAALIAFVPSPLGVFDLFARPAVLEVKAPPPVKLAPTPPLASFDEIAARPLFNADRKPDPVPPPPEAPAAAITLGDLAQYRVLGTVRGGDMQLALVQKSGGSVLTLKPGDSFEGWKVDRIDGGGVSISGGERKEILAIPKANNAAKSP